MPGSTSLVANKCHFRRIGLPIISDHRKVEKPISLIPVQMGWEARVFYELVSDCLDLEEQIPSLGGVEKRRDIYLVVNEAVGLKQRGGKGLEVKRRLQNEGQSELWEKESLELEQLATFPYRRSLVLSKLRRQVITFSHFRFAIKAYCGNKLTSRLMNHLIRNGGPSA